MPVESRGNGLTPPLSMRSYPGLNGCRTRWRVIGSRRLAVNEHSIVLEAVGDLDGQVQPEAFPELLHRLAHYRLAIRAEQQPRKPVVRELSSPAHRVSGA